MNVYDFDQTIYRRDSTADFYFYCLARRPEIALLLPMQGFHFARYLLGRISKTAFKERFYRFFTKVPDMDAWVEDFWRTHRGGISAWYLAQQRSDDLVISASPEFLLRPICRDLGISHLLASRVDPKTGQYTGKNCHGREKVRRLRAAFPGAQVGEFCSDSLSDTPLAELAEKSYIIKKERKLDWAAFAHSARRREKKLRRYADTERFL